MDDKNTDRPSGKVEKGWGYELIFATTDQYCGKILFFEKQGSKFSMHFHKEKDETWFINNGSFLLRYIDPKTATLYTKTLKPGDVWRNPPLLPHQLEALEDNSSLTEVSTADSIKDNYRIIPGDSQKDSKPAPQTNEE
jgi:mannose-6-phosphate isomerase|tara:strand:- start:4056 stop:4469 length:414 start_codon:yes stop_codon:yes gene_type:complete